MMISGACAVSKLGSKLVLSLLVASLPLGRGIALLHSLKNVAVSAHGCISNNTAMAPAAYQVTTPSLLSRSAYAGVKSIALATARETSVYWGTRSKYAARAMRRDDSTLFKSSLLKRPLPDSSAFRKYDTRDAWHVGTASRSVATEIYARSIHTASSTVIVVQLSASCKRLESMQLLVLDQYVSSNPRHRILRAK